MREMLSILLGVVLVAVVATLGLGFYSLFRGGDFARRWSNKLMRLRIILQFTAIVVLASIVWLAQAGHGH